MTFIKTMGAKLSNKVGHDMVKNENKTHVEINTRHVYAKTEGFRLFDIHEEGSGGAGTLGGISGIGLVGEICIGIFLLAAIIHALKKWQKNRLRHNNYKEFYRNQAAAFATRSPPAITTMVPFYQERSRRPGQAERSHRQQAPTRQERQESATIDIDTE